jgi:hypothetical protein
MKWIKLFFYKRRMARRYAVFIGAIGPYLWDVETNGGRRTYWMFMELSDRVDYLKAQPVLNNRYFDEYQGKIHALETIKRYRLWEAQSWTKNHLT